MVKFPQLKTERLILGKIQVVDIPKIIELAGNKKIADNTLNIPHPYKEEDAVSWIHMANRGFQNKNHYTFAIRIQSTNEFIGSIGIRVDQRFNRAELGYWLGESFWNNGYITEALNALLKFGFETLNVHKVHATHLIENPASGKVMVKNGMIKEGELIDHYKKGDEYKSVIQYRLTKSEYEQRK